MTHHATLTQCQTYRVAGTKTPFERNVTEPVDAELAETLHASGMFSITGPGYSPATAPAKSKVRIVKRVTSADLADDDGKSMAKPGTDDADELSVDV